MPDGHTQRIMILSGLASLLLSLLAIGQTDIINHDGVLYLRAIEGDAESIRRIGNWLFYSKLIGWLSAATGLDVEKSAYLLNTLLDLLTVLAFLRFVEELGGKGRTLIWAAILILVLPYLNDNRAEIIRDHGYWAFTMVAMLFYLKLYKGFSWKWLLLWNLSMGLATLFRVEGVAFLLLMPLGLLLRPGPLAGRMREVALCLLPAILVLGILLAWHLLGNGAGNRLTRLAANSQELLEIFTERIPSKATQLRDTLLPDLSPGSANLLIYIALLISIAKDLAESLSWPLALLLLFHRRLTTTPLPRAYTTTLLLYGGISLVILLLQGGLHFVMVSRYTMALALMLLPIVVFTLEQLWLQRQARPPWVGIAIALLIAGLAGDSLIESRSPKPHIREAASWVSKTLPPGSRILTDYEFLRLSYYAQKSGSRYHIQQFRGKTRLSRFDYALVRDPRGALARRLQSMAAQAIWSSGEGQNHVTAYRLRNESPSR